MDARPLFVAAALAAVFASCGAESGSADGKDDPVDSGSKATDTAADAGDPGDSTTAADVGPADSGSAVVDAANGPEDSASVTDAGASAVEAGSLDTGAQDVPDPLLLSDTGASAKPTCKAYCNVFDANCKDTKVNLLTGALASAMATPTACVKWCGKQAKIPLGDPGIGVGNTVGCRLHHAELAAKSPTSAQNHCPAAGPTGGGACGTACENYCHLADTLCGGLHKDTKTCLLECAGVQGEWNGKIDCLITKIASAAIDPGQGKAHCAAAKIHNAKTSICKKDLPSFAATIKTQGGTFVPKQVTVTVGQSVYFTLPQNHNAAQVLPEVWKKNGKKALATGFLLPFGAKQAVKLDQAGWVHYVCQAHSQNGMKGRIHVIKK